MEYLQVGQTKGQSDDFDMHIIQSLTEEPIRVDFLYK